MVAGVNVPHCPDGMQVQVTLALEEESSVTIAAMPAVASVSSAEGGGKMVLKVTTIGGCWYLGSPHATSQLIVPMAMMTFAVNRKFNREKIIRCSMHVARGVHCKTNPRESVIFPISKFLGYTLPPQFQLKYWD